MKAIKIAHFSIYFFFVFIILTCRSTNNNFYYNIDEGHSNLCRIGDYYEGGIIFYVKEDENSISGLICAMEDLDSPRSWTPEKPKPKPNPNNPGDTIYIITTASKKHLFEGKWNTKIINRAYKEVYKKTEKDYAARSCSVYRNKNGIKFEDWYLPSVGELRVMYDRRYNINKATRKCNGAEFSKESKVRYWSSTEYSDGDAMMVYFEGDDEGESRAEHKLHLNKIRPIRKFNIIK